MPGKELCRVFKLVYMCVCVCVCLWKREMRARKKNPQNFKAGQQLRRGGGLKECGARAKTGSLCEPQRATWDGHYVNTHVNRASGVSPSALPSHSYSDPRHDWVRKLSGPAAAIYFWFSSQALILSSILPSSLLVTHTLLLSWCHPRKIGRCRLMPKERGLR